MSKRLKVPTFANLIKVLTFKSNSEMKGYFYSKYLSSLLV